MAEHTIHLVLVTVELFIPHAQSLKSKRRVLRSLKDRMGNLNASVAELGYQNEWQRSVLGAALLAGNKTILDQQIETLRRIFEDEAEIEILNVQMDWR